MSYTVEGDYFDYNAENIQNLIKKIEGKANDETPLNFAIAAYYFVRDEWDYYPYRFSLKKEDWKASNIAERSRGHCLDKAVILITLLRGKGIPSRLGLAKVKNHIAVDGVLEKLGTDVLVPHGYVDIFLNDKWVKATPAFNKSLCEKLGVAPLDFNGKEDSLFQPYSSCGKIKFMEYLEDYGTFNDVPIMFMRKLIKDTFPVFKDKALELGEVFNLSNI